MLGLEVLEWLTILGVASIGMIVVILFIPTKKENAKELMNYQTKINDEVFKIVIEHLKFMSQYELSKAL
ncbi:MAG: hypothetical protein HOE82_05665 [Gammaproteobacteria bacterium]|jgi:pyruvate-formate lyase-activating enzyme|nr:hypothetical protein [Gammaproteobacteria bacterium]